MDLLEITELVASNYFNLLNNFFILNTSYKEFI